MSFAAEEIADAKTAAALTGTGPIAAVNTILALQGVEDSTDSRTRGVRHGEQLLSLLDEVRDGLLAGGIPRATLHRLALAISKRRESFVDPNLQTVLDEPKTRQRLFEVGGEPIGGSAESFAERYRADHLMWGQFIKETGIRTE